MKLLDIKRLDSFLHTECSQSSEKVEVLSVKVISHRMIFTSIPIRTTSFDQQNRLAWTLFINGTLFDILLYAFELAVITSFESKNSLEFLTQKRGCKG